jgi:Ca2+/Na+ antiporter
MVVTASFLNSLFGACNCRGFFDCTEPIDKHGGAFLWLAIALYMCKALRTLAEDYFMPCLDEFEDRSNLPTDFLSATLLAAGSSAALLVASIVSTFLIQSELAVGTVIGSSVLQVTVVIGISGYQGFHSQGASLKIWRYPFLRDACFYVAAWLELLLVLLDNQVEWWEAAIMLITYMCYCIVMYFNEKIIFKLGVLSKDAVLDAQGGLGEEGGLVPISPGRIQMTPERPAAESGLRALGAEEHPASPPNDSVPAVPALTLAPPAGGGVGDISTEGHEEQGGEARQEEGCGAASPTVFGSSEEPGMDSKQSQAERRKPSRKSSGELLQTQDPLAALWAAFMPVPELRTWTVLVLSLLSLSCLAYMLVDAATRASVVLHVSSFAVGLLVVAPAASSLAVARAIDHAKEGEGDLLVANCLGDSLFDILVSLGLPWFFYSMGGTVKLSDKTQSFVQVNLVILLVLLLIILLALQLLKWSLTRRMSMLLLAAYGVYVVGNSVAIYSGAGVV